MTNSNLSVWLPRKLGEKKSIVAQAFRRSLYLSASEFEVINVLLFLYNWLTLHSGHVMCVQFV